MKPGQRRNVPPAEMFQEALRLHHAHQLAEAEKLYRAILLKQPRHADALCMIGVIAGQSGKIEAGLPYLEKAVAIDPTVPDYHSYLADAYRTVHRPIEAMAEYRKVIELQPGVAKIHHALGVMLERQGDLDAAIEQYKLAIAADGAFVQSHWALADARPARANDPEFGVIRNVLARPGLLPADQAALHFALAKMHDDCDEFEQAFAHAKIANEAQPAASPIGALAETVNRVIKTFDRAFFEARADFGSQSEIPIFIAGLPRSGKSLIEHILSRLPDVADLGETKEMQKIAETAPKTLNLAQPFPEWVPLMDRAASRRLAGGYANRLAEIAGDHKRTAETIPGHSLRLGLTRILFPKARIIHCRRDPLDNGLACYFRNINQKHPYTADLAAFGQNYRQHLKLLAHWRAVLPGPYLEVDYEALVAAPEAEARRIVEFCGLAWDPACLESPYVSSPVQTGPGEHGAISDRFVGRWRHYERWLGPLKSTLDSADG